MASVSSENESGEEHQENSSPGSVKRTYHRHSPQQIQHLEEFFQKCPRPDERQRGELSRVLGLEPKQVRFWFQNRRTQEKAQSKRENNNALKSENKKIHYENIVMKTTLDNIMCRSCNVKEFKEVDRKNNIQKLRAENDFLRAEYERIWNVTAPFIGKFSTVLQPPSALTTSLPKENFTGQWMAPFYNQEQMGSSSMNFKSAPSQSIGTPGMEKSLMLETAVTAMREFLELLKLKEPLWIRSSTNGRYFLDNALYSKKYPKTDYSNNSGSWIESSRDSIILPVPAPQLIGIFSDSKKWMDIFPTIVTKARTIGTVDTGSLGGSLHLMYEKLHNLSPLVEPREYIFLRYSRQFDSNTWVIVDTSYNCFSRHQDASLASWKLPSGCKIQIMPNGNSEITWIEHVKVDGKSYDPLFKELIWNCQAFGAKRWLITLKRMCERAAFSVAPSTMITKKLGVICTHDSRKRVMDISHNMVKSFCEILSVPKRTDVGYHANDILISVREHGGPSNPSGVIACMATSLWLPILCKNLFDFFKDEKTRSQWDTLSCGNLFTEFGYIATGAHPENCITLLKPISPEERTMTILQESHFDPLGGLVIYTPLHKDVLARALRGEDISMIPILPSGLVISSDGGHHVGEDGASTSSNINRSRGSILTMVFQILLMDITSRELGAETTDSMRNFMSTTVAKIKAATGCPNIN